MKTRTIRTLARIATVATTITTAACSGADAESTGTSGEAWIHSKVVSEQKSTFDASMNILGVSQTTFQMTNGHGVLTPPAVLQQLMNIKPSTYDFGGVHMSPPWPAPDGTLNANSVLVNGLSIVMSGDAIVATLTVTADLHYSADHWYNPDADVRIDPSTVVLRFKPDGQGGLVVSDAQADMHYYAHECGFGGWCSGIANNQLPDLGAIVTNNAKTLLAGQKGAIDAAWTQYVSRMANGGLFNGPGTWTWTIVPSSEAIANSILTLTAKRHEAPPAPACKVYWDCDSSMTYVSCSNWGGSVTTYRQKKSDSSWVEFKQSKSIPSNQLTDNYYACASDADGQTCSAVWNEPPQSYPQTGLCPKGPGGGPPPPNPICTIGPTGQLVCPQGNPGGTGSGGGPGNAR